MGRADIIERIWQQVEPTVFISRLDFLESLEGWEVIHREIGGDVVGATITRGPEFHFITFGVQKAFPRSLMADCMQPIIDEHGFVRTRTPKEDVRQRRFNLSIGFRVDSEDEHFTFFRMERLNIHRVKPCLS